MATWWASGWSGSWAGGWAGGWAASSGGGDSSWTDGWKSHETHMGNPLPKTNEAAAAALNCGDIDEPKVSKLERQKFNILDRWVQMRRDSLRASRCTKWLKSVEACSTFAPDTSSDEEEGHEDSGLKAGVIQKVKDCDNPLGLDDILMSSKLPNAETAPRVAFTTWQLMHKFKGKSTLGCSGPPPLDVPQVSKKGQCLGGPAPPGWFKQEHGGDFDGSTVDAELELKLQEVQKDAELKPHEEAFMDDVDEIEQSSFVTSHTSMRSSTRKTPAKNRRNLARAVKHKQSKEAKADGDQKSEAEAAPMDVDHGGAGEAEAPMKIEEEASPAGSADASSAGPAEGESVAVRALSGMDAVPVERRDEFLQAFIQFVSNFLMPPKKLPQPYEGVNMGMKEDLRVETPQPTLPRRPPVGATGTGVWRGDVWVPDQPAAPRPLPPPPSDASSDGGAGQLIAPYSPALNPMQRLHARLGLFADRECPLCMRVLTDGHAGSAKHLQMMEEHCCLDDMLGGTPAIRTLSPMMSKGVPTQRGQPLTRAAVRRVWGSHPLRLQEFARRKARSLGYVGLPGGKNIPFREDMAFDLGLVTYDGCKYRDSDVLVPWAALGEQDPIEPPFNGRPGQPPPPVRPAITDGRPGSSNDPPPTHVVADPAVLEQEATWWPVVNITSTTITSCGGVVIVVVCVYQWMWDRPTGWHVRVTEIRSRL
jgi:hypothetical protein